MAALLAQPWFLKAAILLGILVAAGIGWLVFNSGSSKKIRARIERIRKYKRAARATSSDAQSLRRQSGDSSLPTLSRLLEKLPNQEHFRARIERAGFTLSAERYIAMNTGIALFVMAVMMLAGKKFILAFFIGIILGFGLPYMVVGMAADARIKRFIQLFPDAIDLIVRGLRSGLPVTESFLMVSTELADPVGSIFGSMTESIRLGVPVEKSLNDMARKLGSTEFSFFVTSIILQRETGGNLSEILNNLSEVLRNRAMMRLKIKALSSEAKASAYIVGSLPFIVILALSFIQPDYLTILLTDTRGNIAAACAASSLFGGMFIMMRMTKFEI